jgi:hypothetical protein
MEATKSLKTKHLDTISSRISIPKKIDKMLKGTARLIGIRYNPLGVLLEMFANIICRDASLEVLFYQKKYCKLSEAEILLIRRWNVKHIAIAARYNISESMVSKIKSRKLYAWVKG